MPYERIARDLGPLLIRRPPLEDARIEVDDQVVRQVPLVQRSLAHDVVSIAQNPAPFGDWQDVDIWLRDEFRFELDVRRRGEHVADGLDLEVGIESHNELHNRWLMQRTGAPCHEQFAFNQRISSGVPTAGSQFSMVQFSTTMTWPRSAPSAYKEVSHRWKRDGKSGCCVLPK